MSATITDYTADEVLQALEEHQDAHGGNMEEVWHEGPATHIFLRDEDGEYIREEEPTATGYYRIKTEPVEFLLRGVPVDVKLVDGTGGEDQGSGASTTMQIGSQFFRKTGYYASHYGYDWDGDFEEVWPVEKTIVVYTPEKPAAADAA